MNEIELETITDYTCPICLSDDLKYEEIQLSGDHATQKVTCNECGRTWTVGYDLVLSELTDIYDKDGTRYAEDITGLQEILY